MYIYIYISLRRNFFVRAGYPLTSRSAGSFAGALGRLTDARSQTLWAQPFSAASRGSATTVLQRLVSEDGNVEGPKHSKTNAVTRNTEEA